MLQRVEAEVGQVGRFGMAEDAEDAALVFELVELGLPIRLADGVSAMRAFGNLALSYAAARLKNCLERRRPDLLGLADRDVDGRSPPTEISSRDPPVVPIRRAGTPAARGARQQLLLRYDATHARRTIRERASR